MTNEEAKKAGFRTDANGWATTWRILKTEKIRRLYSKVSGLDSKDFPTRAKAREALRKRKENEEVNRKSRFIDNFVQPMQEHLSSKSKADAEHTKWLADKQSQMTPITSEQAKMLRDYDTVYHPSPIENPNIVYPWPWGNDACSRECLEKGTLYFTRAAAQAALDKAKLARYEERYSYIDDSEYAECVENRDWAGADLRAEELDKAKAEAEPLEWCERKEGDTIDWSSDEITWDNKGKENWQHPTPFSGLQPKVGDLCDELGIIRARYRNPLWLAKHGRKGMVFNNNTNRWEPDTSALDELVKQAQELHMGYETDKPYVESHETQVGETQAKEVVTGETQATVPAEVVDHATFVALGGTPTTETPCDETQNKELDMGFEEMYVGALGYTQDDIDKSELELRKIISHPSHYTSHPSGVECITITKHMNFCRGNAMKYLWRAGQKGDSLEKEIEDIAKAEEYCRIEKERLIATKGAK